MEGDITARMGNLVIQIGVLLFAVRFFGFLAKKARISSVLGELIAGVVIGPYALGAIPLPGFPSGIFSLNSVSHSFRASGSRSKSSFSFTSASTHMLRNL